MGTRRAEQQIVIEASQQECFDAVTDVETFPDWQRGVADIQVLSRHRDGRGKEVLVDTGGTQRYTLAYSFESPYHVSWTCSAFDADDLAGELVFETRPDGTTLATFSLAAGGDEAVALALEDLKARVEA